MAMRRSVRLSWLLALAACEPGQRPLESPVATPAASPATQGGPTPRPRTRPDIRSCAASGGPKPVDLDPRINLGEVAGVTWLFGYAAGDAVLARLGRAGELATTKVPLHNAQAGAIDGDAIWLYAPRESDAIPTRWAAVDVRDPDAPVTGPVEPLQVGARLDYAVSLAVGTRRALVVTGVPDEREMVLLDRATRAAVAPPHAPGKGFLPVASFCDDARCAVVAVTDEGGGPERRLVVIRVLADGAREQEPLAPGWIGLPHAADLGDRVVVAWPDHDGASLRALDRWGRTVGPIEHVPKASYAPSEALLAADGRAALALGGRDGWTVRPIGPDAALGPPRTIPGTPLHFLLGAPLVDGLAWINVGGDVRYEEIGHSGAMTHAWHSSVVAGFLPDGDAPVTRTEISSSGGPGRGGLDPFLLVRPGAASVLVVPRGDAQTFSADTATLTPLRTPCP